MTNVAGALLCEGPLLTGFRRDLFRLLLTLQSNVTENWNVGQKAKKLQNLVFASALT